MSDAIRVLVVDDSSLFRDAVASFVSELDSILVVGRARDGQEALELVPLVRPHVVLMDLAMPRLDGIEATRALKQAAGAPAVIVCTADDDLRLRRAALAAGADSFVLKRELGRKLEVLLRTLAGSAARRGRRRRRLGGAR